MAYFDDPKNREDWELTLNELRVERERRSAGQAPGVVSSQRENTMQRENMAHERVPVSFAQLLAEDQAERGVKVKEPSTQMSPISNQRTMEAPESAL